MSTRMSAPLDPVAAYDRIAPAFALLAEKRKAYLSAVEDLIIAAIPAGSRSLLDVGAGDGSRGRRIAASANIRDLALLEPALAMQRNGDADMPFQNLRAEDLHRLDGPFDVILCLWNVLGHILPAASRTEALRQFARLLAPGGRAFVDVSHRYNASHYGALPTAVRFLRDQFWRGDENHNVIVTWPIEGACTTTGHVFTHGELRALCRSAGLNIERRFVVNYATGKKSRWSLAGHLLYVLSSAIAS